MTSIIRIFENESLKKDGTESSGRDKDNIVETNVERNWIKITFDMEWKRIKLLERRERSSGYLYISFRS